MPEMIIREIAPNPFIRERAVRKKKARVAAYCRVSTDEEEQLNSFHTQINYYTEKINTNPNWKFAGIFADEGISGTQTKKRLKFNEMIELCEKKKIDLVLTKSISRFARNTVDCLNYVRRLKAIGVHVIFEKENINTGTISSEMLLSLFSAFAQAESESISMNVTQGIRGNFSQGKFAFRYNNCLGYEKGVDGKPKIKESGAVIIRMIFTAFLDGDSFQTIKTKLESNKILSPSGKEIWSCQTIKRILSDEKYMGDIRLQKTFTSDFLTKKVKVNKGEVTQYYIENNHPAIISKEMFNFTQEELARRKSKQPNTQKQTIKKRGKHSGKYALSDRLFCADCGCKYRRVTWSIHGRKEIVWRCINRLEFGTKYCSNSPTIKEHELHKAIMNSCMQYLKNTKQSGDELHEICGVLVNPDSENDLSKTAIEKLDKLMEEKSAEFDRLLVMVAECSEETDVLDLQIKQISYELAELRSQKIKLERQIESASKTNNNLVKTELENLVCNEVLKTEVIDREFSNALVARVIEQASVSHEKEITVKFVDGVVVKVGG